MRTRLPVMTCLILGLLTPLADAQTALRGRIAQSGFGGFYPDYYGGWGAFPYDNSRNEAFEQQRLQNQQIAAQRNLAMLNNTRTMMMDQAQTRTQAIQNQRQDYRDWWFQTQQQQTAQRQAWERSRAQSGVPMATLEPSPAYTVARAPAVPAPDPNDVIQWPALLRDPRFAAQRAMVEAPYRRSGKEAIPTTEDYRNMVLAADQMKAILKQMVAEITAQQYLNTEAYLDQLAGEARGRLEKVAPATPAAPAK